MKVKLLIEFEIPPHPNHTSECASIVADHVQHLLRANTNPDTEVRVSLFTPPAPVNVQPYPTR